jgi:hypothetical protein
VVAAARHALPIDPLGSGEQLAAARKALDKSFFMMVGCVMAQGDTPPDDVAELLARFA